MNGEGGAPSAQGGGGTDDVVEPEACNDAGTIQRLVVSSVPAGIRVSGIDGLADGALVAGLRGDGRVMLQRLAADFTVTAELLGEPDGDCGHAWASSVAVGSSGVHLSGTVGGPFKFGAFNIDDGSTCHGPLSGYVLTASHDLVPTSLSHYPSGAGGSPPVKGNIHEIVVSDGTWLGGWFQSQIDIDGTVYEAGLEEQAILIHRTPSGAVDEVDLIPDAFRVFFGGVKEGLLGLRWREKTAEGDDIERHGVWAPGTGPVWVGQGPKRPRPHPLGWVNVSHTSEIIDDDGETIAEAPLYGATVYPRAIDVNASGAVAIAGDFEEVAELPGCTLSPTGQLTSFVAVYNADLTLRHARVLGTAREGPASTYDHAYIPTNRIRGIHLDDDGGVWVVADVQLPITWDGHTTAPTNGTPQCVALGGETDECVSYDLALLRLAP